MWACERVCSTSASACAAASCFSCAVGQASHLVALSLGRNRKCWGTQHTKRRESVLRDRRVNVLDACRGPNLRLYASTHLLNVVMRKEAGFVRRICAP